MRLKYNRQWGSMCPPRARMKYPSLSARTAFRSSVSSTRQRCVTRIQIPETFLRLLHSDGIDVCHRRTFTPTNLKAVTGDATSDHSPVDPLVESLMHVTPPRARYHLLACLRTLGYHLHMLVPVPIYVLHPGSESRRREEDLSLRH